MNRMSDHYVNSYFIMMHLFSLRKLAFFKDLGHFVRFNIIISWISLDTLTKLQYFHNMGKLWSMFFAIIQNLMIKALLLPSDNLFVVMLMTLTMLMILILILTTFAILMILLLKSFVKVGAVLL